MKRALRIFGAVSLIAALASCNKEASVQELSKDAKVTVTLTAGYANTKVSLGDDDKTLVWNSADQITVKYDETTSYTATIVESESEAAAGFGPGFNKAHFTIDVDPEFKDVDPVSATYGNGILTEQTYVEGGFANGALPLVADSYDHGFAFELAASIVKIPACLVSGDVKLYYTTSKNIPVTITLKGVPETGCDLIYVVDAGARNFRIADIYPYLTGKGADGERKTVEVGKRYVLDGPMAEIYHGASYSYAVYEDLEWDSIVYFQGEDVYIKNIFPNMQNTKWVKGTKNGSNYVFEGGQVFGDQDQTLLGGDLVFTDCMLYGMNDDWEYVDATISWNPALKKLKVMDYEIASVVYWEDEGETVLAINDAFDGTSDSSATLTWYGTNQYSEEKPAITE